MNKNSIELEDGFTITGNFPLDLEIAIDKFSESRHDTKICPSRYCCFVINDDMLVWDGGENEGPEVCKLWLDYLIREFFIPYNLTLDGRMYYWHECNSDDKGYIEIINNEVSVWKDDGIYHIRDYSDDELIDELIRRGVLIEEEYYQDDCEGSKVESA